MDTRSASRKGWLLALSLLCLLGAPAASPADGGLVLAVADVHSGSISPPLDLTPRPNTQSISGVLFEYAGGIGGEPAEGFGVCGGSMRSVQLETVWSGGGSGSFSCSTFDDVNGGGSAACSFEYSRIGSSLMVPSITCNWAGGTRGAMTGTCELSYEPVGFPASSYEAGGTCALS